MDNFFLQVVEYWGQGGFYKYLKYKTGKPNQRFGNHI